MGNLNTFDIVRSLWEQLGKKVDCGAPGQVLVAISPQPIQLDVSDGAAERWAAEGLSRAAPAFISLHPEHSRSL
ncbi:uncharacterized [Tachysurus ichikawai]